MTGKRNVPGRKIGGIFTSGFVVVVKMCPYSPEGKSCGSFFVQTSSQIEVTFRIEGTETVVTCRVNKGGKKLKVANYLPGCPYVSQQFYQKPPESGCYAPCPKDDPMIQVTNGAWIYRDPITGSSFVEKIDERTRIYLVSQDGSFFSSTFLESKETRREDNLLYLGGDLSDGDLSGSLTRILEAALPLIGVSDSETRSIQGLCLERMGSFLTNLPD